MDAQIKSDEFPKPGTLQWSYLNIRRAELIHRKVHKDDLSEDEKEELGWLQQQMLIAVRKMMEGM